MTAPEHDADWLLRYVFAGMSSRAAGRSLGGEMGWHRRVEGELGQPVERGIPTIPERWKLPVLVATCVVCLTILTVAIVYGLRHG
jgi:hypothetical protein